MRSNNQSALALISLACIVLLAACNSSTPVLQYVTITPPTGTTPVGGTFQFTAQAYYSNGSVQDGTSLVTWASSNASVATIVTGGLATGVGGGTTSITATAAGTAGASATLTVNAPVSVSVSPQTTATGTGQTVSFTANVTNGKSGMTWTASAGTVDVDGNFVAPAGPQSMTVTVTATSKDDTTKSASATVNVVAPGQVTGTANVQVASYTISPAAPGNVSVQFGPDMNYGLTTWTQPTGQFGGAVNLYVAGMKQSTVYHMRGVVQFADGTQFTDTDRTFTTGAVPPTLLPNLTVTTTPGMTPQSGVELLDMVTISSPTHIPEVVVTDLAGNVLWAYQPTLPGGPGPNPVKLLPNGHFLISYSGQPDGNNFAMQEVDLGGNVIWLMTAAQLNQALAAATCAGCNITVIGAHHDFVMLPNGHLILLASTTQVVSGTTVTGDVLIDVGDMDTNLVPRPVWLWNEFDHLDITRQPYFYPDWTHTNAVLYSPDDGNLIISIRHQNWLVKIDYNNGTGTGNILWHLGYQGDFTLLNADGSTDTNATDWFYAQHAPSFVTPNTSGKFSLVLFDNGDDRGVSIVAGGTCGVTGQPACYTTVPLLELDETAMTATLAFHPTTLDYSFFGGNAEVLKNGNVEYDECASTPLPANNAKIVEVTQASPSQTVWQMQITGQFAYRGFRIPSLYPGVQW
jgi:arylsulfate sulfotransferase